MLDAKAAFSVSGSLPQNVNYAIEGIYAQAILDTGPESSLKLLSPSETRSGPVDRARNGTVMILSYV